MQTPQHAVVIVGSGPSGLMLAGELALAGVDFAIVERRADQNLTGSRAGGLLARTLELFDQRGIVDRFLAAGQKAQVHKFAGSRFDISDFPTRHPYGLGLWQNHIERILAAWVRELGVTIRYGMEVTGVTGVIEDDADLSVELSDGTTLRTQFLVGCDGGRSVVRKAAGIAFPGADPTVSHLIAQVEMSATPELGVHRNPFGIHAFGRRDYEVRDGKIVYADHGPIGVTVTEEHVRTGGDPTLDDLKNALVAACGTDYGVHSPIWISRFTNMARQAESYRKGRVLLVGDAAHVHSPEGGQGLNTGVQDAMNLGWKLAQVVKGISSQSLLNSYHAERHPVAARVLRNTMAAGLLSRNDDRTNALRGIVSELLDMEEPRKRFAGMMSGLDLHYDLGEGHPLLGRRMPDLDVVTDRGAKGVFSLLHDARPLLLNLGVPGALCAAPIADRVRVVEAQYDGPWELPVLGTVAAPSGILVRPDGYVAWVGQGNDDGLADALDTWFGLCARSQAGNAISARRGRPNIG